MTGDARADDGLWRHRVTARMAYSVERRLITSLGLADPGPPDGSGLAAIPASSPWDIWWACYRAGSSAASLGLVPYLTPVAVCQACVRDVAALVAADPPGHPESLTGSRACGCLDEWAVRMRTLVPSPAWPPLGVTVAVVKPGADTRSARHHLAGLGYEPIFQWQARLTARDVRRMYPDAYGASFVARQDAYLTAGPVQVLILLTQPTGPDPKPAKTRVRELLGGGDVLRNHLHMPDNPGDALCDLAHFAGTATLLDLYRRHGHDTSARRLACYRAVLARR